LKNNSPIDPQTTTHYTNTAVHFNTVASGESLPHLCSVFGLKKHFVMRSVYFLLFMVASLAASAQSESTSVSISRSNSKTTYRNSNGLNSFDIEIRGTIEVSDDDRDISNMSHDGYFEVTKTSFGSRRSIKITREGSVLD
jgi:hypothetical protein